VSTQGTDAAAPDVPHRPQQFRAAQSTSRAQTPGIVSVNGSRTETLSVSSAAAYIEELKGHRPNPATLFRWMQQGRLHSFHIGRRKFTTRAAVQQLLESFNAPKPAPQAAAQPRADVAQAGAEAAARIAGLEG
jgi:hypothetical protein